MSSRRAAWLLPLLLLVPAAGWAQTPPAPSAAAFQPMTIDGASGLRALQAAHGPEGLRAILHLNRVDLPHVRDGARLVVPATPSSVDAVAPFPHLLPTGPWSRGRMIVVSRRVQAFAAYDDGVRVRWGGVSTGREETATPAGLFATNWKSKLRRSSDNAEWLLPWYVNLVNATGVSFHQFALPGYPASHACVRLFDDDARWIYAWVDSWVLDGAGQSVVVHGTPVLVFGDFDYDRPGPWTRLADDAGAATITVDELAAALEPHRAAIEARAATRAAWLAAQPPKP